MYYRKAGTASRTAADYRTEDMAELIEEAGTASYSCRLPRQRDDKMTELTRDDEITELIDRMHWVYSRRTLYLYTATATNSWYLQLLLLLCCSNNISLPGSIQRKSDSSATLYRWSGGWLCIIVAIVHTGSCCCRKLRNLRHIFFRWN